MHVTTRDAVLKAYERALTLGGDESTAAVAAAQSLCLPVEAVVECVNEEAANV